MIGQRRNFQWARLTDAEYEERFERLCVFYHPAVAAVMAESAVAGPGAKKRLGARINP